MEGNMPGGGVDALRDITFARAGDVELALDIYRPTRVNEPLATAVYFHGGGWARGNRRDFAETRLFPIVRRGIVIASASYRLQPRAVWPAQLDDARAAFLYLAEHADEFGIDRTRIGAWGYHARLIRPTSGCHHPAVLSLVRFSERSTQQSPGESVAAAGHIRESPVNPERARRVKLA
jgi:BD-FAE protein